MASSHSHRNIANTKANRSPPSTNEKPRGRRPLNSGRYTSTGGRAPSRGRGRAGRGRANKSKPRSRGSTPKKKHGPPSSKPCPKGVNCMEVKQGTCKLWHAKCIKGYKCKELQHQICPYYHPVSDFQIYGLLLPESLNSLTKTLLNKTKDKYNKQQIKHLVIDGIKRFIQTKGKSDKFEIAKNHEMKENDEKQDMATQAMWEHDSIKEHDIHGEQKEHRWEFRLNINMTASMNYNYEYSNKKGSETIRNRLADAIWDIDIDFDDNHQHYILIRGDRVESKLNDINPQFNYDKISKNVIERHPMENFTCSDYYRLKTFDRRNRSYRVSFSYSVDLKSKRSSKKL